MSQQDNTNKDKEAFEEFIAEEKQISYRYIDLEGERLLTKIWQAALLHARATPPVVVLPKKMYSRDSADYAMGTQGGFNDALVKIRALNPDVKFVEAEEKE